MACAKSLILESCWRTRRINATISRLGNLRNRNFLFRQRSLRCLSQLGLKQTDVADSPNANGDFPDLGPVHDDSLVGEVATDTPFMVPTQVVKKGHFVHQSPRFFTFKPHEKMIWLTKTYVTEGLPNEVTSLENCNEDDVETVKGILHQIAAFQRNPKKPSTTFHEEEFSLGLMLELLRVVLCRRSMSGAANDLFSQMKPKTETNWFRNFNFYHANYQPSLVLRTDTPLPPLSVDFPLPIDEFPASMPGPYDTYSLGTFQASIVKLKNNIGVSHSKLFSKPLVHTAIQVNTRMKSEEAFQSCALMTAFTQLLASASDQGHPLGLSLKTPMNCNCIVTNGTSMMLMVYQLNTTELQDDRGIWNRAWCTPLMPLYTPLEGFPTKRQFHEIASTEKLEGFNAEAVRLFYKLMSR